MAYQISRIRSRITLLFCVAAVISLTVLMIVTPAVADLAPQDARNERLNYLIFGPLLLIGMIVALQFYLRPISDLGYALEIGSTPTAELAKNARRIAFNSPIYFFIFPTGGTLLVALISDVFGTLFWPDYAFLDHFASTLLITATAACASLVLSLICRQLMRPVLLYTVMQLQAGGHRLNIRVRLFAAALVLTLISLLFTGLFGYNQVVKTYRNQVADTTFLYLSRAIDSMPLDLPQQQILDYAVEKLHSDVVYECIFLLDSEGQVLDQQPANCTESVFDSKSWSQDRPNRLRQGHVHFVLAPSWLPDPKRWVGVSYVVHPFDSNEAARTAVALSISGVFMLGLAALVSHYLAADVVVDLRDVTTRLLNIAHEERVDLSSPVPVLSLDEVGDLILAYNALQQRVQMQQEQIEYKQRQLIALQSLSYKIGTIRDKDHLLQEVIRDVERAFGYHNVSILLVDEQQQELFFAATGYLDLSLRERRFRIGQDGVVGRVAATGTPLLINDVSTCDFYISDHTYTRSELAVPLTIGDKVIGVFNVSSERIGAFEENDLRIVTALGNQVAIAIENARLFSEVMTNASELERRARNLTILHDVSTALGASLKTEEVLSIATERLVSLFEVEHSTVILFGEGDDYGEIAAEYPVLSAPGGRVSLRGFLAARRILTARQPLYIADAQRSDLLRPMRENLKAMDIQSTLIVPLMTKGSIAGIISLDSIGGQRSFTPEEIDICQTIAAQTAVSVENVRLFENLRMQADMLGRMARDVAAERSQLNAILRNLADGLLVTDTMGRIVLFNPAFLSLFNLSQSELKGQFVTKVVPHVPIQHLIVQTSNDGAVHVQEVTLPDGRFFHATAAGVRENDQVSSVIIVLRDVTREKQLDEMKSDFISTVSHEFRTPLTPVLGFAKLIRKSFNKNIVPTIPADHHSGRRAAQRIEQNLDIVIGEIERLSALVEDVLFLADLDAGRIKWQPSELNLGDILLAAVDTYRPEAQAKDLTIRTEWPTDLPPIYGDTERLTRAIRNILDNAVKFTDEGEICVRAQEVHRENERWEPQPFVRPPEGLPQKAYVLVSISDTGSGISLEAQKTLFERFGQGMRDMLTEKPAGTGLGLALSTEIVAYHGGHIWVESEPEQGSTFAFVLPVSLVEKKISLWGEDVVLSDTAPTILVVDDEPAVRELLHYILSRAGYRTLLAVDGPTALNMARTHKPDLMVLDIMIPGISGLDVTSVLKADEETQDILIVILSILADREKAAQLGADACFAKPFEQDIFLDTLARLLAERKQATQSDE